MKPNPSILLKPYQAALRRYLTTSSAKPLQSALRLGRQGVILGLETIDLALIHEEALLVQVLPVHNTITRDRLIKRARVFFAEAITPIEQTHRAAMESNIRLSQLNEGLSQRTTELATSNRQLKKEISRRQVVEENLRNSEQHTIQLLEKSRLLQEQLRLLSRGVLSVQEEERKRISRELHDVIAQMLMGINVRLAALKTESTANTKGLTKSISQTQRLVERSVDIVHQFACELRPAVLDDLGLIPALHASLKAFSKKTGIRVSLTSFSGIESLSIAKRTALYRVAHEALSNVARHAHASRADVTIRKLPGAVCMDISDNGRGFDTDPVLFASKPKRLGLLGIRERVEMLGGKFTVESAPGKGTTVHAQVPFNIDIKEHAHP